MPIGDNNFGTVGQRLAPFKEMRQKVARRAQYTTHSEQTAVNITLPRTHSPLARKNETSGDGEDFRKRERVEQAQGENL